MTFLSCATFLGSDMTYCSSYGENSSDCFVRGASAACLKNDDSLHAGVEDRGITGGIGRGAGAGEFIEQAVPVGEDIRELFRGRRAGRIDRVQPHALDAPGGNEQFLVHQ